MTARRQVGAYEWRNELDKMSRISQQMADELVELSRHTSTVDGTRTVVKLLSYSNQIAVNSLKLREYQVKPEQDGTP